VTEPVGTPAEDFWLAVLADQGVSDEEVARAREQGTLEMLAVERHILDEPLSFTLSDASDATGLSEHRLRTFWRALGFPDPRPGELVFTQRDLSMLGTVLSFIDAELLDEAVALQMARVIGSSLLRVAVAQVEAAETSDGGISGGASAQMSEEDRAREVQRAAQLLPVLAGVIEAVWRRHLATAARTRLLRPDDAPEDSVTVGFADLEGFTTITQQLPEHELAELVNRFEQVARDVVAEYPEARVVKMIGDEVMFTTDDIGLGARLALDLADAYARDEALGDVRVGLAAGRALKLEGDLYGPAVNLASRIVQVAYPGTVVVSPEVHDALEDAEDVVLRSIRSHHLRNIGRVRLWQLRRAERLDGDDAEAAGATLRNAKERRAARRAWIAERMAGRLSDLAADAAGEVTDRTVRKIIGGSTPDDARAEDAAGAHGGDEGDGPDEVDEP
jgi:adenylate cyclase